jgi:hypothetical protein
MQQIMDNIVRREGGRSGAVTKDTDGSSYGEFSFHQSNVMDMLNATGYSKHFQGMQVNSPEFNKQFASLESPEFSKAQRDYWDKTYFQPAVKYSPSLVAKSPVTAEVVADTYNQYGPQLGKKILDSAIAGRNPDELDPSEFIRLVQAYKRDNVKGHFNKYLTQNPNDEKGLLNRINDSEAQWLAKAGTDTSVSDATGSLPFRKDESESMRELREKLNVERFLADSTVGRRLGIDPAVHQQFVRPMDVNGSAYKPVDDSYGVIEGMYKGMRSSWAMIWADKMANKSVFFGKDMELSYDEIMGVAQEFGGNLDKAFAAMSYSDTPEALKKNIQLVKDHDELRRKMSNSAWYTQLLGGFAEAAFSPDTYIPFMASKTAGAVVMGAVGNALSTSFANSHLGTNDDIIESAVIGGVAGGALFKAFGYLGKGAERLGRFSDQTTMRANLIAMGKEVPDDFGGSQRLAVQLNKFRTKMESIAPNHSMSIFNVVKNLPEGELKDLFVKALANEGAGYLRSSSGKAQRVVSELMTLDEMARNRTDAVYSIQDSYALGWQKAQVGGISKEVYSRAYVDAMEGKMDLVPELLKKNEDFMNSVKRTKEEFGSDKYFPTMVSYNKMSDRINDLVKNRGLTTGQAKEQIKAEIKNDLLKSLEDEKSFKDLKEWYQKNVEAELKAQHEARIAEAKARAEKHSEKESKTLTSSENAEGKVLDHEVNRAEREIDRVNKNIEKEDYRAYKETEKLLEESNKKIDAVNQKYDALEQKVDDANADLDKGEVTAYQRITEKYENSKKQAQKRADKSLEDLDKATKERAKEIDDLLKEVEKVPEGASKEEVKLYKEAVSAIDKVKKDYASNSKSVKDMDTLNRLGNSERRALKEISNKLDRDIKKLGGRKSKELRKLQQRIKKITDKATKEIDSKTAKTNKGLSKELSDLDKQYLKDLGRFEKGTLKRLKAMKKLKDDLKKRREREIKGINKEFDQKYRAISRASKQRVNDFINSAKAIAKRVGRDIVSNYNKGQRRENKALLKMIKRDNNIPEPYVPKTDEEIKAYFREKADEDANGYVNGKNGMSFSVEQPNGVVKGVNSPIDFHETKIPWNHSLGTGANSVRNNTVNPMMAVEERLNVEYGEKFLRSRGYVDTNGNASQEALLADLKRMYDDAINNSRGEFNAQDLAKALDLLPRMIFNNIGGRHDASNWLGAVADILRNVAFMTKNSYMGLMNLFEQGEAIKAYGAWHIIKSIPAVNEMLTRWGSGNMTAAEGKAMANYLYGKRVRQHEFFSDIREMSLERQAARFKGNKALAAAVGWSEQLAFANPFTKFLKATEDNIVLAAQDSFTGELVSYAFTRQVTRHSGTHYNKGFFSQETLDRNNISNQEMTNLLKALKENVTYNQKDGSWTISKEQAENLKKNVDAFATLRRLGDYVAQEVIQKNNLSDTNLWAGAAHNPLMNLALQFKTFAMRSYNKRIAKSMQRAAEGDEFGQALTVMIGTALGTASAIAQTGLQTLGMTEEQREKFLEKVYGSTDWKNDSSIILAQGVLNGAMRSSIFASVGLVTGALGINPQIRSTNTVQYGTQGFGDWMVNNVPAFSTFDVILKGAQSGFAGVTADDDNTRDRKLRQFYNSLGRLTNIPFLSKAVPNWLNGEYR